MILYVPSTIFQLYRDGSSWVEPVLSLGLMCLAQGPQRSDAGEALTRGPSVSSQALTMMSLVYCIHVPLKDFLIYIDTINI